MAKRITLVLGLAALMSVSACKKDSNPDPTPPVKTPTKTDLLTAKKWRISAQTLTLGGFPLNEYAIMKECKKDDFYQFGVDKVAVVDNGATKCDPQDAQTVKSTWEFTDNESKIRMDKYTYDLVSLSDSKLQLRLTTMYGQEQTITDITMTAF